MMHLNFFETIANLRPIGGFIKKLEPLVKYIDFRRIKPQILANFIEPLEIVSNKIIFNFYRYVALSNNLNLSNTRGKSQINEIGYVWDKISIVKMLFENNGIFEWDVIIEKDCNASWVGVYGAKITVHIDMNKRTCFFTVNGTKYPEVSAWNNLSSKLYPVVSLKYPGRIRIQPHQKS
ncbi:2391_t:CDS:2 [Rhizophagus irregularis]|nr:2391_t:CDS:2 [Rhizophagus irregularis]